MVRLIVVGLLVVLFALAGCDESATGQPLVMDVDANSEIGNVVRAIFQDSRGTLWVGGEGDLFRNDGRVLTSFDLKDDQGKGVTIKSIVEDKEGNIWCGTTGGITRIDRQIIY